MKFEIINEDIVFSIDSEADREDLQSMLACCKNTDSDFLANLLETWQANGKLYPVAPEWIGALTEAPIVSDDVVFKDNGDVEVNGRVWWFPNYAIESFAETLIKNGVVTFTAAPSDQDRPKGETSQ